MANGIASDGAISDGTVFDGAFGPWHRPRIFVESCTTAKGHTTVGSSLAALYLLPHRKVRQGSTHPVLHGVVVRKKLSTQAITAATNGDERQHC